MTIKQKITIGSISFAIAIILVVVATSLAQRRIKGSRNLMILAILLLVLGSSLFISANNQENKDKQLLTK